ncbi:GIY-YIG nuclease family protein [Candidatus Peregrinibacteria bacterium]|jgi:hypothetical protein|nr:GIY-YIG nuclease family protein [Candidatus Peregrinibacteria bacterium]
MKGIVYILTNDAMPDQIKIGLTTNSVEQRIRELDNTSLPLPFRAHFAIEFADCQKIEKLLHTAFDHFRTRKNREFFEMEPEQAVAVLNQLSTIVSGEEIKLSNEAIDETGKVLENKKPRSQTFNFEIYKIPVGSILTFSKDENETCEVIYEKKVKYDEKEYSLSALALELLHKMGYNWKSARGAAFWKFEDELLTERQKRFEEESGE